MPSDLWIPQFHDKVSLDLPAKREEMKTMKTQLDFVKEERKLWKDWKAQGAKADDIRRAAACFHEAYAFLWMTAKYEYELAAKEKKYPERKGLDVLPEQSLKEYLEFAFVYFDESKEFVARPDVELTLSEAQKKFSSSDTFVLDDGKLQESETFLHVVSSQFNTTQQNELTTARKKCLTALEILKLMEEQLKDARNVAYHKAQDPEQFPEHFKLAGVSREQSEANMKERAPKIAGWLSYYLDLPSAVRQG